ncbi:discoidin domain-containing protein [Paenibacillus sp. PSB04]|uniref:discoidin domain-containing protein n=1 Tax=Paenibacillus sp. PSB04 TaxID=2866810 RepID=UPI0021F0D65F|nr:discoidin domain-containing protein [Paenibacillus sp. PSB04]
MMPTIKLELLNRQDEVRTEEYSDSQTTHVHLMEREEEGFTHLACQHVEYAEGDRFRVTMEQPDSYIVVQMDETLNPSFIYVKGTTWEYEIPLAYKRAYPENAFAGSKHYVTARYATENEISQYRNLALNPHDQKQDSGAFPHAHANVETRNDPTFFARNAIDGVYANYSHGSYPYQSWGINQQPDAELTLDFGRKVQLDRLGLVLRGDFPHDSWWKEVTVAFSDGSEEQLHPAKIRSIQYFDISPRTVEWLVLKRLIKGDETPFPALTQIEAYGRNI